MTATGPLLVFLGKEQGIHGWLQLAGEVIAARGDADTPPPIPPPGGLPAELVAIVPGEDVAIHWLEMPKGLSQIQATAAARLMAQEISTQPISEMHVAVGPEVEASSFRCIALTSAISMAGWLGRCQVAGMDPDIVLPEPLLIQPQEDKVLRFEGGMSPLYRASSEAYCVEPELAPFVLGDVPVETLEVEDFEAGLPDAIRMAPVNLRQGSFAKRRAWKIQWKIARRLALLAGAILLVTLAIQMATMFRYTFAADRLEVEIAREAAAGLPAGVRVSNPARQLDLRLSQIGTRVGFGTLTTALFGAVRTAGDAELVMVAFDGGALRATVTAGDPGTAERIAGDLRGRGFNVDAGPPQNINGRQTSEIMVRGS